jgi:hypothetical protein
VCIFLKLKAMIRSADRGLEVVQDGVDPATQARALFSFAHDLEQLLLGPPGRAIPDPDEALQLQGGRVLFGLGQKVHSLEPLDQKQYVGVKDCSCGKGNLGDGMIMTTSPLIRDKTYRMLMAEF